VTLRWGMSRSGDTDKQHPAQQQGINKNIHKNLTKGQRPALAIRQGTHTQGWQ
jgi:hypothetical protein